MLMPRAYWGMHYHTWLQVAAATHMHASNSSNQCSQVCTQAGVGYLHIRLSETISTCTIWTCARLNTFFIAYMDLRKQGATNMKQMIHR